MITLNDLEFYYDKKGRPALSGVSATLQPGIHLLAGMNGSGKTTLLKIIAGILRPTSGCCLIDGTPSMTDRPSQMGRTFLLEENMYFPEKTIRSFAEVHSPFYPSFSPERFVANLAAFGLSGDEPMRSLSLGNRKKAQLAYVLALGVEVLLLDEPTNGLDIQSKETLRKLIVSNLADDQTLIVATHTVAELEKLFDAAIILNPSTLLYAGTADDVAERLAFRITPAPMPDAYYVESQLGRCFNVCDADPGSPTDIDWRLLYMSLYSPASGRILQCLNSSSHE